MTNQVAERGTAMPIRFVCECGKKLKTHEGTEGKRLNCSGCGKRQSVPGWPRPKPGPPLPEPARTTSALPVAQPAQRPPEIRRVTRVMPEEQDADLASPVPTPTPTMRRGTLWTWLAAGGVMISILIAGAIAVGVTLHKKSRNSSQATVEEKTLHYTPVFQEPALSADEHLAIYMGAVSLLR